MALKCPAWDANGAWGSGQAAAFYLGMLAYYWVLATPGVGFLFGAYLYVGVNWFHVHYDEAFSSLQAGACYRGLLTYLARSMDCLGLMHTSAVCRCNYAWLGNVGLRVMSSGGSTMPQLVA